VTVSRRSRRSEVGQLRARPTGRSGSGKSAGVSETIDKQTTASRAEQRLRRERVRMQAADRFTEGALLAFRSDQSPSLHCMRIDVFTERPVGRRAGENRPMPSRMVLLTAAGMSGS
jgi:hypothetical protein